jgi:16S rRNA (guanine527-N7)-methyltransferase
MSFNEASISAELSAGLQALVESGCLPAAVIAKLESDLLVYLGELAKWNRAYNLTAVRDPQAMVTRHLLDSLTVHPFLRGRRILDAGTGAGLPGIPLALTNPDKQFVLLDSNGKKTRFVQHAVGALGLHNVEVVQARIEQWETTGLFDTVISRAFSSLQDFVVTSGRCINEAGCLLAMKGRQPSEEIEALPDGWAVARIERVNVPGLDAERHIVVLEPAQTRA